MTAKTELSAPKRRTRAEVQQLVAEFASSGMRRSEFCQSRGLSFSTLDRHLKKLHRKRMRKPISSAKSFGAGGVGRQKIADAARTELWAGHGTARRASDRVQPDFDPSTFERLVGILERA